MYTCRPLKTKTMKSIRRHGVLNRGTAILTQSKIEEAVYIETRVERALKGEGDVDMVRSPYFTPRDAGVPVETNIRSDKMDILLDSISMAQNEYYESRKNRNKKEGESGDENIKGKQESPVKSPDEE